MYENEIIYQIALSSVDGVGDVTAKTLISYCGSAEKVFTERRKSLEKIPGIGPLTAASISAFRDFGKAEKEIENLKKIGGRAISYQDENYPKRLKMNADSPLILYYRGNADLNQSRIVAIVGTRKATAYGRDFTHELVRNLKSYDCLVLSGLAYGIDIAAHKEAIACGLATVGVVGHGLDIVYPWQHKNIAKQMEENGGMLSEYPIGTAPDRQNFPSRNKIVAGMCDVCVVPETAVKGGAMITAEMANAFNRDVMALPGRVYDEYSAGCNHLIKTNKAHVIESASDLIYLMGWDETSAKAISQTSLFTELSPEEKDILALIPKNEKIAIDEIFFRSRLPVSQLSMLLLDLELKGLIRSLPGKSYQLR